MRRWGLIAWALLLAGCATTRVSFERLAGPLAPTKGRGADLPIYTATEPPLAPYLVVGRVTVQKAREQLQGLTGPIEEKEILALLRRKAQEAGAEALLNVQIRERMASLKRGEGGDLPEEVSALAHWGCNIVHYVEATADTIVFQRPP
jgi:hypothetical protein